MDITPRKAMAAALERANRAHVTLSAGSVAVMRARDERELLESACNILVGHGRYRTAAVGYASAGAEQAVDLVAFAGEDAEWLPGTGRRSRTDASDRPIDVAIRDGRTQITRNISEHSAQAWRAGALARGFKAHAALPLTEAGRAFGALSLYADDPAAFDGDELTLLEEFAGVIAFGVVSIRARDERDRAIAGQIARDAALRENLEASIQAIAATIETRDAYTAGHQRRVAALATAIGQAMGLPETTLHALHLASIVHDVGKIRIPAEILSKPTTLTSVERELVKMHAEAGYDILKDVRLPWPIADIVRQHHERIDGSGYPHGITGEHILLEARIVAVADAMEAMASHRPYRPALGVDAALAELRRMRGVQLDERVVDSCVKLFEERAFRFDDGRSPEAASIAP
jgi:HD-GYP domain-containing protein (c-di-GMP phosphodiesterase class II)